MQDAPQKLPRPQTGREDKEARKHKDAEEHRKMNLRRPKRRVCMTSSGDIQAKLDDFQAKLNEINDNLLKLALVALNDTQFCRYSYITKKVCPETVLVHRNGVPYAANQTAPN